jgi:hypothetical protein
MIMFEQTITSEQIWSTVQEPRCPAFFPSAYLLLLSAIDNGWRIDDVELAPSWDQTGFIFLVTVSLPLHKTQQLILPKNNAIENLLFEQPIGSRLEPWQNYPMAQH